MVISLRRWLRSVKYLLLFAVLTYTLYRTFGLLEAYMFQEDKYRIPDGSAVKVFHAGIPGSGETSSLADRLKLFYWYGE
ncbi:MAG: DUF4227 family protein [Paenibacillus macerans]|uniref:DUF4227 family protein n=1 Tax=Paenibacillus macerans TaxID=44252 RepID=A0A6N8EW84_PAEMA|nr:DUF4227 family protein [Paenibacillus macerans]MCM3698259.1 YqzK family protein [Paenibacillus macerans]MDU7472041.1 DUF4227 family protein [Paenibacillus macerans]MUG22712.1 DUF4227 family protein [Paenibacillus macerans]